MPKPNREPVEVDIIGLHPDGYGVDATGRIGVTGALPGETVTAQPFTKRRGRLFARTIAVDSPHADRVEPVCEFAHLCGGCSLQHFDPTAQLADKARRLEEALADVVPERWLSPLTGPVSHYRSKARVGVKYVKGKGRVLVGFREKMSPLVADIDHCEILSPPFGELLAPLQRMIETLSIPAAIPQIELAAGDRDAALVFRHLEALSASDEACLVAFGETHHVDIYTQSGGPGTVSKLDGGEERLHYALNAHGMTFAFHPMEFTQVNQAINEKLVDLAIGQLELEPSHHVLDLFCGIGNFTLPLSRHVASIRGVELSASSVERGRENAARNAVGNATFEVADLFENIEVLNEERIDRVLLDPPRSGAEAVCQRLVERRVPRVVYISCNPATLARDVQCLVEGGYTLEAAGVIDMFPHTTHVESIAVLR